MIIRQTNNILQIDELQNRLQIDTRLNHVCILFYYQLLFMNDYPTNNLHEINYA